MADNKYYWLTEEDRKLLDTLAQERRSKVATPRYESPDPPIPQAPEVYVARTSTDGIPALTQAAGPDSEDVPGYADCRIYQILRDHNGDTPRLVYLRDEDKTVYNIHLDVIGGNRWIPVIRDKFGRWLALSTFPSPEDDDPTGDPEDTGTGTSGLPIITFPPPPHNCEEVYFEETDLFCEVAGANVTESEESGTGGVYTLVVDGLGPGDFDILIDGATGSSPSEIGVATVTVSNTFTIVLTAIVGGWNALVTGSGEGRGEWQVTITSLPSPTATVTSTQTEAYSFLNLYKRSVAIGFDALTGCLARTASPWVYVRTLGCCDFDCVDPNTGTGNPNYPPPADCCPGVNIPLFFTATISNANGLAASFPATATFVYVGNDSWRWNSPTNCDRGDNSLVLACVDVGGGTKAWRLYSPGGNIGPVPANALTPTSLSPLTFVQPVYILGCPPGLDYTITFPFDCEESEPVLCDTLSLPRTLLLTLTLPSCSCLEGSYILTYDEDASTGGYHYWYNENQDIESGCVGGCAGMYLNLLCHEGTLSLSHPTNCCLGGFLEAVLTVESTDPLEITGSWTNVPYAECTGCTSGTATATITEVP